MLGFSGTRKVVLFCSSEMQGKVTGLLKQPLHSLDSALGLTIALVIVRTACEMLKYIGLCELYKVLQSMLGTIVTPDDPRDSVPGKDGLQDIDHG